LPAFVQRRFINGTLVAGFLFPFGLLAKVLGALVRG
jgi:hypothetical protein